MKLDEILWSFLYQSLILRSLIEMSNFGLEIEDEGYSSPKWLGESHAFGKLWRPNKEFNEIDMTTLTLLQLSVLDVVLREVVKKEIRAMVEVEIALHDKINQQSIVVEEKSS